eukprot:2049435-Pyramimonas_sp.AAC.1
MLYSSAPCNLRRRARQRPRGDLPRCGDAFGEDILPTPALSGVLLSVVTAFAFVCFRIFSTALMGSS